MRAPANEQPSPVLVVPRSRRWPTLLLGVTVGVAGTIGANALANNDADSTAETDQVEVDLATAPIEERDLIEEVEWTGDLAYGAAVEIAAPREGTVTATPAAGTVLRRGDAVTEIDQQPVVVLYGAIPAWRDLDVDAEGPDVQQLEANLVALGYDPDATVTVDEIYTDATAAMVERLQDALELEPTGVVAQGDVLVVEGPVTVTTAPRVGDPARQGEVLGSVSARAVVTDVIAPQPGTVESVIDIGTAVNHGDVLYVADGVEVLALTDFSVPEGADDGVERNFVLVPPGRRVASVSVTAGDIITEPGPILTLETQTLSVVVSVALDAVDSWFAGQAVSVTLPDDTEVAGEVFAVGTVAQGGGQGQDPTVDVEIEILERVDDDLPASEVIVTVAGDSVFGATVVPSRALVTLAEGGFAVETVLDDGTTVLVAVETGTFDDGVVQIESSQLSAGDLVVVPQ